MRLSTLSIIPVIFLVFSCGNDGKTPAADSALPVDSLSSSPVKTPAPLDLHAGMQVDCKTFEIVDSSNAASKGWGYELYVGDKRVIRQVIMPAIGGINYFPTEADAKKMGDLAAYRFGSTGDFPTIFLTDYDSLQIKLSPAIKKQVDSTIAAQKKNKNGK